MSMAITSFLEKHYIPERLLGNPKVTLYQYRNSVKMFGRYIEKEGTATFDDLTEWNYSCWVSQQLEDDIARPTINKHQRHLMTLARWAHEAGHAARIPKLAKVDEYLEAPVAWMVDEIGKLLDTSKKIQGTLGRMKLSDFWIALILSIYDTGARKGVLLNIAPSDWYVESRAICLPANKQKQKVMQWCTVSEETLEAIQRIYDPSAKWLFNWTHDRTPKSRFNYLNQRFRELVLASGLDVDNGLFHRIRRTSASYKHKHFPGSATYELGHSCTRVTERYLDPRIIGGSKIVDLMPRPTFAM